MNAKDRIKRVLYDHLDLLMECNTKGEIANCIDYVAGLMEHRLNEKLEEKNGKNILNDIQIGHTLLDMEHSCGVKHHFVISNQKRTTANEDTTYKQTNIQCI